MPPEVTNRFALFAEDDEISHQEQAQVHPIDNPFANQVANVDTPWKEVKRGGARGQAQGQCRKLPTLVIRDENHSPYVKTRQKQRNDSDSTKAAESTTGDPHENWCGVCTYKFASKSALQTHIKTAPGDHTNFCNLCKRVFKDRNGLKNHVDNSAGHECYCNLCLSAFKDDWALKCHFENNYAVGHQWVCLTCLLGFRTKIELTKHLHTGKKHVVCNTCHRTFRTQDERDAHWRETTKHKHCLETGCDFDAPNASVLQKHHEEDHFRCAGCTRILPSQTKLTQHQETCKFEVPCSNCGEQCAGHPQLWLHMQACGSSGKDDVTTDNSSSPVSAKVQPASKSTMRSCFACTKPISSNTGLITHLEGGFCSNVPDPFFLTLCLGKWWYSPLFMDLDLHAQIRRNEVDLRETTNWMEQGVLRPFTCRKENCNVSFARFGSLVAHVEGGDCTWDMERLRLDLLEAEMVTMLKQRDRTTP